jgi:hypothetical protein
MVGDLDQHRQGGLDECFCSIEQILDGSRIEFLHPGPDLDWLKVPLDGAVPEAAQQVNDPVVCEIDTKRSGFGAEGLDSHRV